MMSVYSGPKTYAPKKWNLAGLQGISDATLEMHFGLYEGYVKNANLLNERLAEIRQRGKVSGADPLYADLVRGLGFEYNGMRLHELYFDNMTRTPSAHGSSGLSEALGEAYGGFEEWKTDFMTVGGMRGVGWAIAYCDTSNGEITNHWISDHENGHIAGFIPIVVLDLWEHAFIKDYKRPIEASTSRRFLQISIGKRAKRDCPTFLPHLLEVLSERLRFEEDDTEKGDRRSAHPSRARNGVYNRNDSNRAG